MKLISLNKITAATRYNDTDDVTEGSAVAAAAPVVINAAAIRCFYPRNHGAPGTRITFTDGGGFAVRETFAELTALLEVAA